MKRCPSCGDARPLEDFHRNRGKPDGRATCCRSCAAEQVRRWRTKNLKQRREKEREWARKARAQNPEKYREYDRKRRAENPDRERKNQRRKQLRRLYSLTLEEYDEKLAAQGGLCMVCQRILKLGVDHDHETGQVRDLLCNRCNRGIGYLGEDPERLRAAAAYLDRHRASVPLGQAARNAMIVKGLT